MIVLFPHASIVIGYVCSLFIRKLMLDIVCSCGWHGVIGIMISVSVGFLYIVNSNLVLFCCNIRSRKLMVLCCSLSIVNFILLLCLLN
jgi:hypothetical protein